MEGVEAKLHPLYETVLDLGEGSASHASHIIFGERTPVPFTSEDGGTSHPVPM
jgi:hypothetical protein